MKELADQTKADLKALADQTKLDLQTLATRLDNKVVEIETSITALGGRVTTLEGGLATTNETLKNKGVKRPFVHDLDLHTIEEDEFEQRISIWENNRKSVLTFKDEFNSFCQNTRNSLAHDVYTLRRPQ